MEDREVVHLIDLGGAGHQLDLGVLPRFFQFCSLAGERFPLMFRKLRVLAAFFMLPVVLFASPSGASAAAALGPGPWVGVSAHVDGTIAGDFGGPVGTDCRWNMRNMGGSLVSIGSGYCIGTADVTPGSLQDGEAGSYFQISASGATKTGSACSGSSASTLAPHSQNGTLRVAGTITEGDMGVSPADCFITKVCIKLQSGLSACVDASVPPGEPPPGGGESCALGYISTKLIVESKPWASFPSSHSEDDLFLKYTISGPGNGAPSPTTGAWGVAIRRPGQGPIYLALPMGGDKVLIRDDYRANTQPQTPVPAGWTLEAVAYGYPNSPNGSPSTGFDGGAGIPSGTTSEPIPPKTIPVGSSSPYHGWTKLSDCRFYYGPPVISDPNSDGDVPLGDATTPTTAPPVVTQPPVPPPPPPPTVASGFDWLQAIWAILQSIWNTLRSGLSAIVSAIGGLVAGIVDGIRTMLTAAFVPSNGFLDAKWDGVQSKWTGTSPGKYLDSFTALQSGSVSGCGGLPLNVALPGGVRVDQHIGEACSGSMASAASMVRAAMTAVFAVGGAVACVRAVGSGLGWNPGLGRGDGS